MFFNSTLERIFSNPLKDKFVRKEKNKNQKFIEKKKKNKKAPLTNELLQKNFREIYDIFIEKDENSQNYYKRYGKKEKTKNFKEFIESEKKKEKNIKYFNSLEKEANDIDSFLKLQSAREIRRHDSMIDTNFENYDEEFEDFKKNN